MSAQLELALDARDDALALVERFADDWDRSVVQQIILQVADRGVPFSANAVRPLLPVLRSNNLVGAMFAHLARSKQIRRVKGQYEPSDDPSTHGHPIAVWVRA